MGMNPHGLPSAGSRFDRDASQRYTRRRPEESVLYRVVAAELETFLARAQASERTVPRFVEREFRNFLACGILAHGFVRVHCDACGFDRLVAFSFKGRGFCPSCGGRRMADTAAHLVDRVLPQVPVRQWVLSLPFALRYRLAYDAPLTSAVLGIFMRALFGSLRRRARKQWNVKGNEVKWKQAKGREGEGERVEAGKGEGEQCGAVTFVQRFGGALNLNIHFHSLVLDGVYAAGPKGKLRFHPLPPPSDAEVACVAGQVAQRVARMLERRGLGPEADSSEADSLGRDQPWLAELYGASVSNRIAMGPRAGRSVRRLGDRVDAEAGPRFEGPRCAVVSGVSLHANVAVPARDRQRLERLCRYVARPPVATERLSRQPDGQLAIRLKKRWRDGTTCVFFSPQELMEKLAALVPPPRFHLVRYHGVLGPSARARREVVPATTETGHNASAPKSLQAAGAGPLNPVGPSSQTGAGPASDAWLKIPEEEFPAARRKVPSIESLPLASTTEASDGLSSRPRRLGWAELLRRVFAIDVLECPGCQARMRWLSVVHPPAATRAILACLDLPARAPPTGPPVPEENEFMAEPEADFSFADSFTD